MQGEDLPVEGVITIIRNIEHFGYLAEDVQCQSQQVSQWPSQTVVTQGSSVELQCSQSSSDTYMYWYRQQSSTGITLLCFLPT
ncbi:hypothetical protein SKAU_G00353190 [Synaphobranchus kaupii]|uniref:Ig-like domain-containing protein n=1 Tax=Synaphobranchus kaupii TaxID=118154 RepID=A0A9Q1EKW7_SYNKA|nr:hypothetical protein SKAU_G00353190 [Synaphobranchus kaupii]